MFLLFRKKVKYFYTISKQPGEEGESGRILTPSLERASYSASNFPMPPYGWRQMPKTDV
jgi:hypothetical protein